MSLEKHDPELAGLEAALAALAPMPGRIDRDALLFRAGQVSVRGRSWAWPAATAGLGMVAVGLGLVLGLRPSPVPVERVVYVTITKPAPLPPAVREPASPTPEPDFASPGLLAEQQAPMNYLQLERQVVRWGLEGVPDMPEAPSPSGLPVTRDSMLGAPAGPASFTNFFDLRSIFQ
jgi:hypothetical protein